MRPSHRRTALLVTGVLVLTGCSAESDPSPTPSTDDATTADDASATPSSAPSEPSGATASPAHFPECEPGEGKTVTMLEDIVIPAQEIPGVRMEDFEFSGETVPGYALEPAEIPERVIQQGCIVEYEAPGGCLGATEISGAYIPPFTIPERVLPEVTLPDGTVLEELVLEASGQDEVVIEGAYAEEVCQTEEGEPGSYVSAVFRRAIFREAGFQQAAFQPGATRTAQHIDGEHVPGVSLRGASAPGTSIPGPSVRGASLKGYLLENADDVEVSSTDEEVYYSSQGDVLFGNDEDVIRPEAEAALQAVVDDISDRGEPTTVRVEGHTDDVGTAEHNLDLSQRRAAAVGDWLAAAGLDATVITTVGLGPDHPRADNGTEEGRAQNRRVVITVEIP